MLLFKLVFENQKTSMQLNMCRVAALDMANTNQSTMAWHGESLICLCQNAAITL